MSDIQALMKGDLTLDLGSFRLDSGSFEIPLQGVTVLFGRSGSGKSTLLRAISGLDKRTEGHLTVNGEIWQDEANVLPTQKRHIGFVFQDAALFPHMTVRQNLMYGVKRLPKDITPEDFDDIVQRVGIADKLNRAVTFLSGGERQRVAIARALLMRPKLLCMDEPLSALDWRAKAEMLTLIEELVAAYRLPVLYITHAPAEVERLADRVLFMQNGRVETVETLQQALARPDSPLFDEQGAVSVLQASPLPMQDGLQPARFGETETIWLSEAVPKGKETIRVRVLARDVSLALSDPKDLSIINHFPAEVTELIPQGQHRLLVRLRLSDGQQLFSEVTQHSAERLKIQPGLAVFALIKSVAVTE
ncbi:molybdenum ABC transporter ATP-binding protein [Thiomicrospira sp. S5]|uniref:molybdenum ABC transporter ATP-binding protein n=1 Tax=Thiomicrospira sp. S5 TaxID=1803865 RepID=UPI000F8A201A|nr:molybdenum ABC transporter ATP-binding protein [Thiomicrospira sp. S5]AZR81261.1 molybdenum ABC transporter ATP-binding protein [Thiomicrospira sp. S5]AZR81430.1 molybdenum ABC transporter ATP-binding protein [Thiomicrospira sp. S5]